ncbi:hypothetical protein M0813_00944 [Anaeramoeba flamelloides]|uniref:Homeobox domain-containing protein n=1 Tax=Anaeramoeba flamelloides TaxID=1746091 RepID=A0ABQ8X1P0_9EUKA|nr:hypothetical protein M0813_00944 [Anaeramoeba flamelloides]
MTNEQPTIFPNSGQQFEQSNRPILPPTSLPLLNNYYFYQNQLPLSNLRTTNMGSRKRSYQTNRNDKFKKSSHHQLKNRNQNLNQKKKKIHQKEKDQKKTGRKPVVRRRTTKKEKEYLRSKFVENSKMSVDQLQEIAKVLGWGVKRVARWFTNQRTRTPKDSLLLIEKKQKFKTQNVVKSAQMSSMTNSSRNMKFLRWAGDISNSMSHDIARISRIDTNKPNDHKNRLASIKHLQSLIHQIQQQIIRQRRREDRFIQSISIDDDDDDDDDEVDDIDIENDLHITVNKGNRQDIVNNYTSRSNNINLLINQNLNTRILQSKNNFEEEYEEEDDDEEGDDDGYEIDEINQLRNESYRILGKLNPRSQKNILFNNKL